MADVPSSKTANSLDESSPRTTWWKRARKALTVTKEGSTPVRWNVVFLVVFALFSCSYTITYVFPFLPEMVLSFGYKEEQKGYYAGLVASAMFAGRIFGSYFWGWLSDKKGRKFVIIICTVFIFFTNFLFGFSTNIYMAMISRFLNGLFNGVIGACKVVLYEVSDNTNQGVCMASISLAWGSGIILGPLISGYLASPAIRYPEVFTETSLFGKFPYLLPSLVASVVNVVALVVVAWKLPETLHSKQKELEISTEVEALQEDKKKEDAELGVDTETHDQVTGHHEGDAEEVHTEDPPSCCSRVCSSFRKSKVGQVFGQKDARMAIAVYTLTSVAVIGYDEVFTVFASTDQHLGGMGFGPESIGKAIGLSSMPLIVVQVFLFTFLEARFGARKIFCVFGFYLIFCSITLPSVRVLQGDSTIFWVVLLIAMGCMKVGQMTAFSANGLHVNNSIDPALAGTANGIAITCTSIGRTLAPTVGGSIFAWTLTAGLPFPLDVNCVFLFFGAVYLISNVTCALMSPSLDKQSKKSV